MTQERGLLWFLNLKIYCLDKGVHRSVYMAATNPLDCWVKTIFDAVKGVSGKRELTLKDIWTNCGLVVRRAKQDPMYPVKVSEKKRHYGRDLLLHLPPGLSEFNFYHKQDKLAWAWNAELEFEPVNGNLLIRIMDQPITNVIPFSLTEPPEKMAIPLPIGYSRAGLEWLDLAAAPHLLIAGTPGSGKSNLLHCIAAATIGKVELRIIDLKRLEFAYLKTLATVAATEKDALTILYGLNKEMDRRLDVLEKAGVVKVQDYKDDMPYIVLIIDELAELQDDKALYLLNRLLRLARACGISVVAATQRPSTKVIDGDSRAQFSARICYRVADELNSRMVLGETCNRAAYLPPIPGRAILKWDKVREVQTMYLPLAEARQRLDTHLPQQPVKQTVIPVQ